MVSRLISRRVAGNEVSLMTAHRLTRTICGAAGCRLRMRAQWRASNHPRNQHWTVRRACELSLYLRELILRVGASGPDSLGADAPGVVAGAVAIGGRRCQRT